jgi:carbonic anhydrase/acetyltransferase-like protein (isoleucine patch superfamily)
VAIWALGDRVPEIDPAAWVHPDAHLVGDVVLGAGASVWPGAVLRADFGRIEVGEGSSVQDNCVLHPGSQIPTTIGRDCVVGHAVHLEGVLIEDRVLVGSGAIVLDGALLRQGSVVAAGALVLRATEVPEGQRAQGVPAAIVSQDQQSKATREGAETYVRLAARYGRELRRLDGPE